MNPFMLSNGLRVFCDPYVPKIYPTKWEMRRWRWWGRFFGKPEPKPCDQVLIVGNDCYLAPSAYNKFTEQFVSHSAIIRIE
jgi:hypothetical protein